MAFWTHRNADFTLECSRLVQWRRIWHKLQKGQPENEAGVFENAPQTPQRFGILNIGHLVSRRALTFLTANNSRLPTGIPGIF